MERRKYADSDLITVGEKFQKPMEKGVELLNMVQDVYLANEITIA